MAFVQAESIVETDDMPAAAWFSQTVAGILALASLPFSTYAGVILMARRFRPPVLIALTLIVALPALTLIRADDTRPPRKVAFLVGVSAYDHDFDKLDFAEDDATALAEVLKEAGFDVGHPDRVGEGERPGHQEEHREAIARVARRRR